MTERRSNKPPSHRKKPPKQSSKRNSNNEMDDVMAQLRRQREKQKSNEASATSTNEHPKKPTTDPSMADTSTDTATPKSMGKFRYDPVLKRYLPSSAYKSNGNNDVCIQQLQRKSAVKSNIKEKSPKMNNKDIFLSSNNFTDGEIRRVLFRGSSLRHCSNNCSQQISSSPGFENKNKKHKKNSKKDNDKGNKDRQCDNKFTCSDNSIILLATSLTYCYSLRRKTIATNLGELCTARRLENVPTVVTKDVLCKRDAIGCIVESEDGMSAFRKRMDADDSNNHGQKSEVHKQSQIAPNPPSTWYSMLNPMCFDLQYRESYFHPSKPNIPVDCHCKSYVHPHTSTFNILSHNNGSPSLPHVSTIMEDKFVHYRAPVNVPPHGLQASCTETGDEYEGGALFSNNQNNCLIIQSEVPGEIHGVGLTQHGQATFIGSLSHDSESDESYFNLNGLFDEFNYDTVDYYQLGDGGIHDFCFGAGNSLVVAFAHTKTSGYPISFLNSETQTHIADATIANLSDSDPLCIQYRIKCDNKQLLVGHRDGTMSMLDLRSGGIINTSLSRGGFGSISTIQQLTTNDHLIVAKGSFGACRIFDVRRMTNNKQNKSQCERASVWTLLPRTDVHLTKSTNCTGIAIDPLESVVISPYATQNHEVMAGLWSVGSGTLLTTIKLDNQLGDSTGEDCPLFCELNSQITSGFRMSYVNESSPVITSSRWGVWYKSHSSAEYLPPGAGGIKHISFE